MTARQEAKEHTTKQDLQNPKASCIDTAASGECAELDSNMADQIEVPEVVDTFVKGSFNTTSYYKLISCFAGEVSELEDMAATGRANCTAER